MSILYLNQKWKRNVKINITSVLTGWFLLLFIIAFLPVTALAGGIGDVVTEVANAHFTSTQFDFSNENQTGHNFKMHMGGGDFGNGMGGVTVLGPVDAAGMQIMLDYIDGEAQHTSIQTTRIKGCEVREYTMSAGNGVGVVLPDYFITVEIYESGNSSASDLALAKRIAQQTLDGLERNGLLSQPAPDIEKPAEEKPSEPAPANSKDVTGQPLDDPILVSNVMNIAGVYNEPTAPSIFSISSPHLVTYISTYHWNNARGSTLGTIALQDNNGKNYGPWQVTGRPGQGGVPNAYWEVFPNIVIPAGTYTVIDSDPATWSQNAESGGRGMGEVKATPHFEVTSGSVDDMNKGTSGSSSHGGDWSESPAGVGSVGNIPGPSNTTEAIVGVAVPGLIATGLGALAGLGGGGFAPPGGTSYPSGSGGSAAGGGGSSPGANAQQSGAAREVSQLGKRRREPDSVFMPEPDRPRDNINEDIFIDTVDMGQGAITVGDGLIIEPADKGTVRVQPEPGIIIEPAEEGGLIKSDSGMIIDTVDETGVLIQTDQIIQPAAQMSADTGILFDTSAIENASPAADITSSEINAEAASQTPESAASGAESQIGSEGAGQDTDEDLAGIYDKNGLDPEGYDRDGFDKAGYDREDYDRSGYDRDGFNREGYDKEGFNEAGFDKNGFDKDGFDKEGFDKNGFDNDGFNKEGFNAEGFDKEGFDQAGFDNEGFNRQGFDKEGFNQQGFDKTGFDREGFNQAGFNQEGFDREGFNKAGFDQDGFNREGFDKAGFDREGFNQSGFNQKGFDREGFNKAGFDQEGFNREGFDKAGFDREGFNQSGFDKEGFDREGFNQAGYDKEGFNQEGFNKAGYDKEGFDQKGFNKAGYDRDGYGRNGYDAEGYNREGYDVNGYDRKGYNSSGYNAKGYDGQGYDRDGFNKEGLDRDGYNRSGLDKNGYDREGYDKAGYDKDGYDREGFDKNGRQREGYDENGYDKNGFNKEGFDKDGYDQDGFNYEGYSREGIDPWGYDRQGYGKDGYHWSGYNADGYNRSGMHWTDNPYEGDSPFNVDTRNPFDGGTVIIDQDNYGNQVNAGANWKPTKPPLGEPYHKTLEKYGGKPWTNDPPPPEVEKPVVSTPDDTGVIGPEDPMNTLKNHDAGQGEPKVPEGQENTTAPAGDDAAVPENGGDIPADQVGTGDSNTFTYTDPETGETTTYEYEKGYTGPRQGDTQTLVGKADGQSYELKFDAVKGKWINTETGNDFNPDDFERWQNDLAVDKERAAEDLEKMVKRQDANSKAIDKNLADWKKLEQMQKAADKYGIGEKGGPGDVDKAIQNLKDDMLAGKEVDQDKLERINKLIDNRIQGNTVADTGRRWEEKPWYEDLDSALKANVATAKEVVTGEKDDGSISWLGSLARFMITAATGGGASLATVAGEITRQGVMDGALTVAEAMYRIKDSIDKGESDFRAVSKAIGLTVLGEEMGWLAGAAGGQLMKEMLDKFPVFTNSAADFIEKGLLKIMRADQIASRGLGMVSKEGAEETLKQIEKRLTDLGAGMAEESVDKATRGIGRGIAGSGDDIAKGANKAVSGSGDDIAKGGGKAASGSGDDIGKGSGRAASGSGDDIAKGGSAGDGSKAPDGLDAPGKAGTNAGDGSGEPGKPSSGGPDDSAVPGRTPEQSISRGGRSADQVMSDPAAVAKAERTVQNNIKDFDKLPPAKQQELVREQAIYDEYRIQAEEKAWNLADKVQRGERLTVDDIMEMKADPAAMRILKKIESADGLGSQLTTMEARQIKTEFNNVLRDRVHQPSNKVVEDFLSSRYKGAKIRVDTVRTPGTQTNPWDVNTDNDVIASRLVKGPNGSEWVEIPKAEWENEYYKAFAKNTGFNVDDAARRFPEKNWAGMDDTARYKEWAERYEESAMDVYDPEAARDFSGQRTWMIEDGDLPGRPMIEATPDEIARGVETVNIDGKQMRPSSAYELARKGEGKLLDAEQLGMMEKNKINKYWNKGGSPADIMRNQTESMEQLSKTAAATQGLESSYKDMGYKIGNMPDNMQQAIKVVNNNSLSPAARASRLQELGYDTPGDFVEKLTSRMGAIRTARR